MTPLGRKLSVDEVKCMYALGAKDEKDFVVINKGNSLTRIRDQLHLNRMLYGAELGLSLDGFLLGMKCGTVYGVFLV